MGFLKFFLAYLAWFGNPWLFVLPFEIPWVFVTMGGALDGELARGVYSDLAAHALVALVGYRILLTAARAGRACLRSAA